MVARGMRTIGLLAALALAPAMMAGTAAAAAKCEPEKVATKYPGLAGKKLKVAQDGQSPPYSFRDPKDFNNIVGFDADFARAAMKCIGVEFEFMLGGWSGLLPSVIAGQSDMMWDNLYYTAERAKQVDYVTYMVAGTGALVAKGNPKKITALEALCGTTATAGLGTVEEAAFRDQSKKCVVAGRAEIAILTYPDIPAGMRLIQNGRADVMMSDLALIDRLVAENSAAFEQGFKIITDFKIGVGVKDGNEELLKAIFEAMQVLQADGTEKALYAKYNMDASLALKAEVMRK